MAAFAGAQITICTRLLQAAEQRSRFKPDPLLFAVSLSEGSTTENMLRIQ
jgi:hypothetical protein